MAVLLMVSGSGLVSILELLSPPHFVLQEAVSSWVLACHTGAAVLAAVSSSARLICT